MVIDFDLKDRRGNIVDVNDLVHIFGSESVGEGVYRVVRDGLDFELELVDKIRQTNYEKEYNVEYKTLGWRWVSSGEKVFKNNEEIKNFFSIHLGKGDFTE